MNTLGYKYIFTFENTLRDYIASKTDQIEESFKKAAQNNLERSAESSVNFNKLLTKDLLTYLNLGDLFDIVSSKDFRQKHDNDLWKYEQKRNAVLSIRNDIMHSRIILQNEVDDLYEVITQLLDTLKDRKYKVDFSKVLTDKLDDLSVCIPYVDYPLGKDFIKLFGRDNDLKNIMENLMHSIPVTIAGMGGMGKTAMVLQLIEDLVNTPKPKFSKIIFMSFKDSYFDGEIKSLSKPVANYKELIIKLAMIFNVEKDDFELTQKSVLENLFNESILLVLDNVETEIIKSNVRKFIDFAKLFSRNYLKKSRLIITSRNGIGQIEDKYDLLPLDRKNSLELLSFIIKKPIKVSDFEWAWIERYCEGNPLLIKNLALMLRECRATLSELIVEYENKYGSLAKKIYNTKEQFLTFCFSNTIETLSLPEQLLFASLSEICSKIDIYKINRYFIDFVIDHLNLSKYGLNYFEPNNYTKLTLFYFDNNLHSNYYKMNIAAVQFIIHSKELTNSLYTKTNLISNAELFNSIKDLTEIIKHFIRRSLKTPTIEEILRELYQWKFQETKQEIYLELAFNVNPSLSTLIMFNEYHKNILSKSNLLNLLPPREFQDISSVSLRNQNLFIGKFVDELLYNRDLPIFELSDRFDLLKRFIIMNKYRKELSLSVKRTTCKLLLKLKRPEEAINFSEGLEDQLKFEVYIKMAEEARRTNKTDNIETYYTMCNNLLKKGAHINISAKCQYYLYYGKYLKAKDPNAAVKILQMMDSFKINGVVLMSMILESQILRAECYNSIGSLDNLQDMLDKIEGLVGTDLYEDLFMDKKLNFERRIRKLKIS